MHICTNNQMKRNFQPLPYVMHNITRVLCNAFVLLSKTQTHDDKPCIL